MCARLRGWLAALILGDYRGRPDCPYCGQQRDLQEFLHAFWLGWVGPYDERNEPLVDELVRRANWGAVVCEPCTDSIRNDGRLCEAHR